METIKEMKKEKLKKISLINNPKKKKKKKKHTPKKKKKCYTTTILKFDPQSWGLYR
jgi:hypothetical protein